VRTCLHKGKFALVYVSVCVCKWVSRKKMQERELVFLSSIEVRKESNSSPHASLKIFDISLPYMAPD
jgi:hypothetical protein